MLVAKNFLRLRLKSVEWELFTPRYREDHCETNGWAVPVVVAVTVAIAECEKVSAI